ncbi:hypothetical protein AABM34_08540 [Lysinibacillus fusiformis]
MADPVLSVDFPFLIEWADGDEERLSQLKASGAIDEKQAITMESIQFFVKDVMETVQLWQKVLQLPEFEQHEQFMSLQLPNMRLDFYEEASASSMTLGHLKEGTNRCYIEGSTPNKGNISVSRCFLLD